MSTPVVSTHAGKVGGLEIADGIHSWRGIPYAAAPVGDLRLRSPQPVPAWSGTRAATSYAPPAMQAPQARSSGPPLPEPSEDCLYLNVTAPASTGRGRPVLVWFHGGGYQTGHPTQGAGDGVAFARSHGVVTVTVAHRLGSFGFLSVPGEEHSGAFGLRDQIAALRWVRANIAAFGGDPSQVTVYGISSGAKSVAALLASPLARGLITRAASSSGGGDHVATAEQAHVLATRFCHLLGTGPERIRDVAAEDILAAQSGFGSLERTLWVWRPTIDGQVLTGRPVDAVARGAAAGIPLLAQHCVDECRLYTFAAPDAPDHADQVLERYFGPQGRDEVLAAYRQADAAFADAPKELRRALMTDERYAIPTTWLADAQSVHAPVYRSRYDGPITGLSKVVAPAGSLLAFHGTDSAAVWREGHPMHDAWGGFITTGVPTGDWRPYDTDRRATTLFTTDGTLLATDPDAARRRIWAGRTWPSGTWFPLDGL